jgi:hypothetical protein
MKFSAFLKRHPRNMTTYLLPLNMSAEFEKKQETRDHLSSTTVTAVDASTAQANG